MKLKNIVLATAGIFVVTTIISGFTSMGGGTEKTDSKIKMHGGCTYAGGKSSSGSQVGWTNSIPDGAGTCSSGGGCHSGGAATPVFTLTSVPAFASNTYVPGTLYTVTVKVTGYPKFGFDIEMLNGTATTSTAIGTFAAGTNSQIIPAGTYPKSITHTSAILSTSSATYSWTAPASGSVYIYGDGNGVNGTGTSTGDKAVLFTQVLTPCTTPVTPGAITGSTTVCSGSSNTYSIAAVTGATSYTWTLPGGWTGTSTTTSITTTASATSGNVTVKANNGCGSSPVKTLAVTVSAAPATPGAITGSATVCAGTSHTYSITAVSGATSYTWTVPGAWTGTSTTTSITTTSSSTSGNITVKANNTCGSSAVKTLAVTVTTVNIGISTSGATLTSAATPATYQWYNCGTSSIIAGQTNQNFTATSNGNYGVIVTQSTCVDTTSCININTVGINENNADNSVSLYPNPSTGKFTFEFNGSNISNENMIEIYNIVGEKVYQAIITTNKFDVDMSAESNGIYFAKIQTSNGIITKKLIKK